MINKLSKSIFFKSPFFLKRVFVNLEALRRNYYRRSGHYKNYINELHLEKRLKTNEAYDVKRNRLDELFEYARVQVPFYMNLRTTSVENNEKNKSIPIIYKDDIRTDPKSFISVDSSKKDIMTGKSSGSTGAPLHYYLDRSAVEINYAHYDEVLKLYGCNPKSRKVRLSGVPTVPINKKKPPFWIYVDLFNQLQCSVYHLSESTYSAYLQACIKYNVEFATGYAKSWYLLAQHVLKTNAPTPKFQAIITDSEGITKEEQNVVERAFNCRVYQTYGLGEIGMIATQCEKGNYHIIPNNYFVEIVNDSNQVVRNGQLGEIVVTNLVSKKVPYIRYKTGDLGILNANCSCGWKGEFLTDIVGRVDDYLLTASNRKLRRPTDIFSPELKIKASQIVQEDLNKIVVKVIPDIGFEEASMKKIEVRFKKYLGDETDVYCIAVDELERTENGKIRHVIRNI
ncbi:MULTISPECIES: phenylacetate--CoA ligase family protein [Bacillaceae]|uniref:Phenylacetate--CoA ligase family protein n=1 Tax=Evansella alkalicola TaxID=745819 RepID=A0ABS6JWY3_9BACI|nr:MULTISPECIES: phenylacetate--CoA ligase family protein [Bacillaceae]MBU9723079.1 phenylacetate--CoA ligase family protein [Bacillus alkalicola]